MKRKRIGSIFMAAVLMAVSLVATPIVARAEHNIPGTGPNFKKCNNTYFDITHTGFSNSYEVPGHELSSGEICIPTRLVFIHQTSCTACGAVTRTSWYFQCEEWHSLCKTVIRGQGH